MDAFSLSWEGLKAYAFPPFKMIGPVLRKIQEDRGFVILIAPAWAGQAWFPVLLDLLVDFPRRIPPHKRVLSQKGGRVHHNKPQDLHLHAWPLSSEAFRRKAFLSRCQRELPSVIENRPGLSTTPKVVLRSRKISGRCNNSRDC